MRTVLLALLAISTPWLSACEHEAVASRSAPTAAVGADSGESPMVLVELYTSQGCSSCPPADALLRELVAEGPDDVTVVPLAFHVDYWDRLGWPDPFADARWTERQSTHAAISGSSMIYTPQLLFDGVDHRVGTARDRARDALRAASAQPPALDLSLAVRRDDALLRVTVEPRWRNDDAAERDEVAIMVAVTDGGHRTAVRRGENAGRTLAADFVVRDLSRACLLSPDVQTRSCEGTLALGPVDDLDTMQVVAFAQDARGAIVGVATEKS